MNSITLAGPRCVQDLATILAPQNRIQGRCDHNTPGSGLAAKKLKSHHFEHKSGGSSWTDPAVGLGPVDIYILFDPSRSLPLPPPPDGRSLKVHLLVLVKIHCKLC